MQRETYPPSTVGEFGEKLDVATNSYQRYHFYRNYY